MNALKNIERLFLFLLHNLLGCNNIYERNGICKCSCIACAVTPKKNIGILAAKEEKHV